MLDIGSDTGQPMYHAESWICDTQLVNCLESPHHLSKHALHTLRTAFCTLAAEYVKFHLVFPDRVPSGPRNSDDMLICMRVGGIRKVATNSPIVRANADHEVSASSLRQHPRHCFDPFDRLCLVPILLQTARPRTVDPPRLALEVYIS